MKKGLHWRQWLALFCAFSFLMLGIDDVMSHHEVIYENILSWTPLIFAPIGVIYSVVGIFSKAWRRRAWILAIIALAVGGAGTIIHNYFNILERGDESIWHALLEAPLPVFAPASIASTGLLLFLLAWGEWQHKK